MLRVKLVHLVYSSSSPLLGFKMTTELVFMKVIDVVPFCFPKLNPCSLFDYTWANIFTAVLQVLVYLYLSFLIGDELNNIKTFLMKVNLFICEIYAFFVSCHLITPGNEQFLLLEDIFELDKCIETDIAPKPRVFLGLTLASVLVHFSLDCFFIPVMVTLYSFTMVIIIVRNYQVIGFKFMVCRRMKVLLDDVANNENPLEVIPLLRRL